jgi:hypothetical protein
MLGSRAIVHLGVAMGRVRGAVLSLLAAAAAAGCEYECSCLHDHGDGGARAITVEIGTSDPERLEFVPLEEGGEIPLQTFGQGGTHVTVAIRARGLGTNIAFFDVTVENTRTGDTISTVPSSRPQLWICDDEREVCDQLPVHVMTGGLAPPGIENRDGLRVIVTADVRDEQGRRGSGSKEGVLKWMPPKRLRDAGRGDEDAGGEELDAGAE